MRRQRGWEEEGVDVNERGVVRNIKFGGYGVGGREVGRKRGERKRG